MDKTNVMRLLDGMGISYTPRSYPADGSVPSGVEAARLMGEDPSHVFKTLVTQGASRRYYVFVIPVAEELSLKKAAAAVGEKSIAMLKSKDLLPLTGYVHGGCSPIGMKKPFPTTLDETVELCDTVIFSAGKIGLSSGDDSGGFAAGGALHPGGSDGLRERQKARSAFPMMGIRAPRLLRYSFFIMKISSARVPSRWRMASGPRPVSTKPMRSYR